MFISRENHNVEALDSLWRADAISDEVYTSPDTLCLAEGDTVVLTVYEASMWVQYWFARYAGTDVFKSGATCRMDWDVVTDTFYALEDQCALYVTKDGRVRFP